MKLILIILDQLEAVLECDRYDHIHCSQIPVVWNHLGVTYVLLWLNGANFYQMISSHSKCQPHPKHVHKYEYAFRVFIYWDG